MSTYMSCFPADMAYPASLLAAAGCPHSVITTSISAALNHVLDDNQLSQDEFDTVAQSFTLSSSTLTFQEDQPITIPYIGYTIAGTPDSRWENDLEAKWRRFPNLSDIPGITWETFHIPALSIPADSPLDVRCNPLISHMEFVAILACSGLSANSAYGGWRCDFTPPDNIKKSVEVVVELAKDGVDVNSHLKTTSDMS